MSTLSKMEDKTDLKCYVRLDGLGYSWCTRTGYSGEITVSCILAIKLGKKVMIPSAVFNELGLKIHAVTKRAYLKAIDRIDEREGIAKDVAMVKRLGEKIGVKVEVV